MHRGPVYETGIIVICAALFVQLHFLFFFNLFFSRIEYKSITCNNSNNKMTSLAPISSENPSSVVQQNQRRKGHFEKISFQITAK